MQEIYALLIGIVILVLGFPIGHFLASRTKEELKDGEKYFRWIVWIGLIGGFIGLLISNDVIMFSFFFTAIVTSRSVKKK